METRTATAAGFIGLGKIGTPMAQRLAAHASSLSVYDVRSEAMEPLVALGARACASPSEVAATADIVCIVVLDDAQVIEVISGEQGLLESARPGTVVCVSSTVRPQTVFAMAELARAQGVHVIDAGVAGGAPSAETGTLVAMLGGDSDAVARARPVLMAFSKEVIHAGPLGAGMRLKLIKNHLSYLALAASHEGRRLAEAAGIDAASVQHLVRETRLLEQFFDFGLERDAVLRREPDADAAALAHAREYSALARKDLDRIRELGDELGVELPLACSASEQAGRYFLLPFDEDDEPKAAR